MCNSFTTCSSAQLDDALTALREALGVDGVNAREHAGADAREHRGSQVTYPGMEAPLVLMAEHAEEGTMLVLRDLPFGIPATWKNGSIFNARLESVLSGEGLWAEAATEGRCILPCASFFETHGTQKAKNPQTGRTVKQRCSFTGSEDGPLYLAAVRLGDAFAVVTTAPNQDVAPVHDRMPLVLTAQEAAMWMDSRTPLAQLAVLADRSTVHLTSHAMLPEDPQLTLPLMDQ